MKLESGKLYRMMDPNEWPYWYIETDPEELEDGFLYEGSIILVLEQKFDGDDDDGLNWVRVDFLHPEGKTCKIFCASDFWEKGGHKYFKRATK